MFEKTFTALGFSVGILLVIGFLMLGPWLTILAVNQLFNTAIQFTFWNWLSVVWLHLIVAGTTKR